MLKKKIFIPLLLLQIPLLLLACKAATEWEDINYAAIACDGPQPPKACGVKSTSSIAVGGTKR